MKSMKPLVAYFSLALLLANSPSGFAHEEESQSISGKILLLISTHADSNASEKTYHFSDGQTNKLTELHFKDKKIPEEILNLVPGSKVKIKGKKAQGHILFDSLESTEPIILNHVGTHEEYPVNALSGTKSVLALKMNFLDKESSCSSEKIIYDKILNPAMPISSKNFYDKSSHGLMTLTGEVASVTVNLKVADQTYCNYSLYEKVGKEAAVAAGYNLANYTHHMFIVPSIPGCPGGQGYINSPPTSWIYNCNDKTITHELGHNFGLHHAGDSTPYGEYMDGSDTMGRAYREFNAPHKHQLGWLPINKVIDITAPGTYRISPLNAAPANADYAQIYRVYDAVNNFYYYLSYRDKSGEFDKALESQYADRLNITRYRGTGADITRFVNAIGDGGSEMIPFSTLSVKNNARTASYIEMIITETNTTGDKIPPTVSITSPVSGSKFEVGSVVTITASASDNVAVARVEFYRNGLLICTDTTAPYNCNHTMQASSNIQYYATAYDTGGNMTKSTNILLSSGSGGGADTTAPSVSLTSPSNGSSFAAGSTVTAGASASDNVGVSKVEFYVNNSLKCSDTTSPYSCSFLMPTGSNIPVRARAYDAAGNMSDSAVASISETQVDSTPPSVSLTSPSNGAEFAAASSVLAAASASDNVGVSKVEFYVNNALMCSDSTSPYSCSFSMPTGSSISVKARAHDAAGNMKDSAISYISNPTTTVDNTPPSVPQGLSLQLKKRSDVNLSFSASTDNVKMSHYEILRNNVVIGQSTSTNFTDPKVPGGSYSYQVRAVDAAGNKSALSSAAPLDISGKGQDSGGTKGKGKNR